MAGSLLALAATTHAAESGLAGAPYWLHATHLAAALAWLGGLTHLCAARFGRASRAGLPQLRAFSRAALPLFLLAMATGVAGLAWRQLQGFSLAYLAILGLKLGAVGGIARAAWRLRGMLPHPGADFNRDYDATLGTEIFLPPRGGFPPGPRSPDSGGRPTAYSQPLAPGMPRRSGQSIPVGALLRLVRALPGPRVL